MVAPESHAKCCHLMELVVAEWLCTVARLAFGALFLPLGVRLLRAGLGVRSRRTFLKHIRLELFTLKASALMPKWTRSAAVKFDEATVRRAFKLAAEALHRIGACACACDVRCPQALLKAKMRPPSPLGDNLRACHLTVTTCRPRYPGRQHQH
jgi:hypothetical protein